MSYVISGVTDLKFTKFLHDVARSLPLLRHAFRCQHSKLLWNANAENEGVINPCAIFALKLVTLAASLGQLQNEFVILTHMSINSENLIGGPSNDTIQLTLIDLGPDLQTFLRSS